MLFDEPTTELDPIVAVQVLDLIIRARDINKISSLYVTKKMYELPYLADYRAVDDGKGEIVVREAPAGELPATRVILLDNGRIIFSGSLDEFQKNDAPAIKELAALDPHDHSKDPYFPDPWDKRRRPKEEIL
jgi:ABC-type multidrug transport system ATPase subunit